MTKKEKLTAIYEKIANKKLTRWCIISIHQIPDTWNGFYDPNYEISKEDRIEDDVIYVNEYCEDDFCIDEVTWHPVMIWDVLDWILKNNIAKIDFEKQRKELRKPIDNQSDECIDYVYNLIK